MSRVISKIKISKIEHTRNSVWPTKKLGEVLYNFDTIEKKTGIAIGMLLKNDAFLLENFVHERSVAHKLAEYLQILFKEWDVDCEYDKKGLKSKLLDGIRECNEQKKSDRVLPDIIIHHRNSDKNLLVIEIKTKTDDFACDKKKLELFTSSNGEYRYSFGLYIKFNQDGEPKLIWYINGRQKN